MRRTARVGSQRRRLRRENGVGGSAAIGGRTQGRRGAITSARRGEGGRCRADAGTDPATLAYRHEAERLAQSADPETTYIEEIMPEKLAMNLDYLAQRNTLKDLRVFMETIITVVGDRFEDKTS